MSNWFAPAIVNKLGSKLSLILSVIPNICFIFSMYEPYQWSIYLCSALLGMGGGILWTANGEVIAKNSPGDTKPRNTGIFWSWFNMSALVGNTFLYFQLGNSETISDDTRHTIYLVLGGFSIAGLLSFVLLKPNVATLDECEVDDEQSAWQPIKDGMRFAVSPNMGLLYGAFIFTGLSLNFWSSVYIVIIGNVFPKRNYLALAGICVGIGQVSSGFVWSVLTYKIGRKGVLLCTTLVYCTALALVYLAFPSDAATTAEVRAQGVPIIASNIYLSLFIALLIGLGDGGFNVTIYATLGQLWEETPAPAFAVFKFVQGMLATVAFLYCGVLLLPYQLLILALTCVMGSFCFLILDYKCARQDEYEEMPDRRDLDRRDVPGNNQFYEELEQPLLQGDG